LLSIGNVDESIGAASRAVALFERLPSGMRQRWDTELNHGSARFRLGRGLEARANAPATRAARREADLKAACLRFREGMALLEDSDRRAGKVSRDTDRVDLHAAVRRCDSTPAAKAGG
jgi:hypothetical protein